MAFEGTARVLFIFAILHVAGAVTTYTWGSWGDWGSCISNCPDSNTGTKTRTKECIAHITTANHTTTHSVVYIHCGISTHRHQNTNCSVTCPINGGWGGWTSWSTCSVTTGTGSTERHRSCNNPAPAHFGKDCTGISQQHNPCTVNVWSDWTAWSQCTVTCGTGEKLRMRHCVNGSRCDGATVDKASCALLPCSVDGGWSTWSDWSGCSVTCGYGGRYRNRACDSPAPLHGGRPCAGVDSDIDVCYDVACPIDGGWGNFTSAGSCSVTCGVGVAYSTRKCENPPPQFGGKECEGSPASFEKCEMPGCLRDGGWTGWSNLTSCNSICGMGMQRTLRTCTAPAPANGGRQCTGDSMLSRECDNGPCPSDIKVCDGTLLKDAMRGAQSADFNCYNTSGTDTSGSGSSGIDPKGMISEMCLAPGTDSWIIGVQVSSICSQLPIYSPLASLETGSRKHKYAILLDCFQEILTIATMDCQGAIQKATVDLEHTPQEYHLLTW
ncbi:coadhesin-like [Mya arenaria]|uniref:coadhesin-like n=1 Tax=Mya arenaria TaxID=6604 RepID=UPI0022E2887B|nr:coadhesin-like [Mya arenaria]